jgi:hypothetical protein
MLMAVTEIGLMWLKTGIWALQGIKRGFGCYKGLRGDLGEAAAPYIRGGENARQVFKILKGFDDGV